MSAMPTPFAIPAEAGAIADLHERLDRTRWTDALDGWTWGTDAGVLRDLVHAWRHEFDWTATAARLDEVLPSTVVDIDGRRVQSARRDGVGPDPFPLVLLHGWPSSFAEMERLSDLLVDPAAHGGDPADAFTVVVPSLPGHGYSATPAEPAFGADDCADVIRRLMVDVHGFERFGAHGGDRGAFVSTGLGARHADVTAGIHITFPLGLPADPPTDEDLRWMQEQGEYLADEGGYIAIQSTRPQTLGFGLNDSPVGLLAWLVEKWRSWSDCDGDLLRAFTVEQVLTNATIYWMTGTIRSSMHWYWAHRAAPPSATSPVRVECPTGVAAFPHEVMHTPRSTAARKYDIRRWTEMPRGGHFSQMEEPELLAHEIREFFRPLR
jgi:pimeloyl-ACP methyl ester carboxylesterase